MTLLPAIPEPKSAIIMTTTKPLPEPPAAFDFLVSQWAGLVSQACKAYLRPGGVLVANNSHADAGLAALDPDYQFIGVVNKRRSRFSYATKNLEAYFHPKRDIVVTRELLERTGKGVGYTKTATAYLFRVRK